jgi:nicotinate-nucleotide pyrophosphorylase (carboxylating)
MTASTEMPTSFAGTEPAQGIASSARQERLRRAFFRGEGLHLKNPEYVKSVRALLGELLSSDIGPGDLTVSALQINDRHACAQILAKEPGVIAGVAEFRWLVTRDDLEVKVYKQDGERIEAGEIILEVEGRRNDLLVYERVGLNLLQRMSGIATATRHLQDLVHRHNPEAHVIGTRKTPWGLLDKRALHLGGAGTHRLGLWDAILVKNNHLALLAGREEEAVRIAVERIWPARTSATFVEVEVGTEGAALAAAQAFRRMQEASQAEPGAEVACVLLLDNMPPAKVSSIIECLRAKKLLDCVLTEASGNISETDIEEYAASGVDAISIGALTHSVRALDLCERL